MPKGEGLYNTQQPDCKPGEIARDTELAVRLASLPQIDKKDAEQVRQRCQQYFDFCREVDQKPGVQGLCLALGVVRATLIAWENENSERGAVIVRAKQIIRYLLETWTTSGKLSPPVGIFWAKNIMGYKDNITIEAQTATPTLQADKTPEQIERELLESIPIDDE